MTSFGSFSIGSAVSATGSTLTEAFESYRRAQYLVAGSAVAATSDTSDIEDGDYGDEEGGFIRRRRPTQADDSDDEYEPGDAEGSRTRPREDSFVQFVWDDDEQDAQDAANLGTTFVPNRPMPPRPHLDSQDTIRSPARISLPSPSQEAPKYHETTPLLARKPSTIQERLIIEPSSRPTYLAPPPQSRGLRRRSSAASHLSQRTDYQHHVGKSTYGQTLFNSIAILLGIGMLSEPLAFAYAGWGLGTALIIFYALISCYTAKILARIILADPRLRSYSDIGRKAFGPRATGIISTMFCLELFAITVVLVTLYADSLHTLMPEYSRTSYKIIGLLVFIPTVFLPLSLLSYTSILGIISTVMLAFVIFVDGFSKTEAPGSLWEPAETAFGCESLGKMGLAFGLFMAGFSGHPVIPSLARDMADPSQFDHMINWAFIIATFIYAAIGAAGYLMFGKAVHDEISVDLLNTPGYEPWLNQICLWLLVVSPLSKYGLTVQPLNTTIDILLGVDSGNIASPEDVADKPSTLGASLYKRPHFKRLIGLGHRLALPFLSVMVSVLIPEFSSMMAFLGSFSAFMLAVVGPILAKVVIDGRCSIPDGSLIVTGVVMAVWGTMAAANSTG